MISTILGRWRGEMTGPQWLSLVAIGLVAWKLAVADPVDHAADGSPADRRVRDYLVYFHAHQLFQRGPDELNEDELDDVNRWCRCLRLMTLHQTSGVDCLTIDECRFVIDALDDFWPDLREYAGYRRIHESCAQRLAGGKLPAAIASVPAPRLPDDTPMLE
jgi:hypothetical protein